MDEFEETLNRVLSDPAEMEKLTRIASRLMGGGEASEPAAPSDPPPGGEAGGGAMPDAGLLGRLQGLMGSLGAGPGDDKAALLKALAPYLREDRRQRLEKALRMARAARIAGVALNEFGGEGGAL